MNKQEIKKKAKKALPVVGAVAGVIAAGYGGVKLFKVINANLSMRSMPDDRFMAIAKMLDQHFVTTTESVGYEMTVEEAKDSLSKILAMLPEDSLVDYAIQKHVDMK